MPDDEHLIFRDILTYTDYVCLQDTLASLRRWTITEMARLSFSSTAGKLPLRPVRGRKHSRADYVSAMKIEQDWCHLSPIQRPTRRSREVGRQASALTSVRLHRVDHLGGDHGSRGGATEARGGEDYRILLLDDVGVKGEYEAKIGQLRNRPHEP